MFTKPPASRRRVGVTQHHKKLDRAEQMWTQLEEECPQAQKVILVMHNLNAHSIASLHEVFWAGGGSSFGLAVGDPLHAESRQLVEHRRNRIERVVGSWTGDSPPRTPESNVRGYSTVADCELNLPFNGPNVLMSSCPR